MWVHHDLWTGIVVLSVLFSTPFLISDVQFVFQVAPERWAEVFTELPVTTPGYFSWLMEGN